MVMYYEGDVTVHLDYKGIFIPDELLMAGSLYTVCWICYVNFKGCVCTIHNFGAIIVRSRKKLMQELVRL